MKKQLKNQKGFTLVEVIVVAVIVAVLAAVAIPLYLNYIQDSRSNAAKNAAGSLCSFCAACINSAGTLAPASGAVAAGATITCTPPSGNTTTMKMPDKIGGDIGTGAPGATVTATHSDGGTAQTCTY
jgi:prepilin-type N-terminal cleavage/methylation domain-containing protein